MSLAAGRWGSGEVKQRNHDQHSLCVPSFLEVRGFRGIHEHPAIQNKEDMTQMKFIFTAQISVCIFLCFILLVEEEKSHLGAGGTSVSGLAGSAVVTLREHEQM